MQIGIVAIGRVKAGAEKGLCERYLERAAASGRALGLGPVSVREIGESRAGSAAARKREEAAALLAGVGEDDLVIALDERGEQISSEGFSGLLDRARETRKRAVFIIGGADGLDAAVRKRADHTLAFGAITLPHQIARAILLEQIYRAMTILSGHPYHRA
ncbi:MAG: 23S rRNA (pseudouridine(1915)-N(3))-methyltransferase RlmH [Hyphomicrobiaceae bacterium]|nr:23S rRNA (pseudouridine(1915)-N(3))-methyltransferase RlmH [Hyphomicrobiaceae bacterium]